MVVAAVIRRGDRVLIAQRPAGTHQALRWEFPGGRVEPGEHPEAAVAREIKEELGWQVAVGRFLGLEPHTYPDRQVFLLFYECALAGGPDPQPPPGAVVAWVRPEELARYDLAPPDRRMADRLAREAMAEPPPGPGSAAPAR